jgi:hypothetical protein
VREESLLCIFSTELRTPNGVRKHNGNGNVKRKKPLTLILILYAGHSPAYPMKPKASSKNDLKDFKALKALHQSGVSVCVGTHP